MSDNPFAHLIKQQPAPPPPTIGGTRVLGGPPPSERRAEEDQAMERTRLGLSIEDQQIQRERLRLSQEQDARDQERKDQGFDATEGERKAAAFLMRALGANTSYEGTGVGPRSLAGQFAKDTIPDATNYFTSSGRQVAESAQDEFIAASLRQDSGAAIPEEELERQRRIYFPMPGDGPEAIEQKRQARIRAIEGLKQSSGRLLDSTMSEWQRMGADAVKTALDSGKSKEEILAIAERNGLSLDMTALDANITSRDAGGPTNEVLPPDGNPPSGPNGGGGNRYMTGLAQGVGDLVEGAASLPSMVINPIGQAIYDATGYGDQTYDLGDILRGSVGLPESPDGVGKTIRQGAAAALTGAGAARAATGIASNAVAKNALSTVGRTPVRDTVAGGAAAGAGDVGHDIGGIPGQIAGTVVGGLAGYAGANALATTTAKRVPNALAEASARQGVDMLPADAGGAVARGVTTGAKASPLSVAPIVKQAQTQQKQFSQAARRAGARGGGEVVNSDAAGESVRSAAQKFTKETAERGSRMYDRAAQMARNIKAIRPARTVKAIDEAIARLEQNPAAESGTLAQLKDFKAKIESGVSIQGLRDARTSLSQGVYDGKLRGGVDQRMWKDILGNVADDIDDGLRSVGQDSAADAFRSADNFWSGRVEHIDNVLQPIIGKDGAKGGEQILGAIESMARGSQGGNARLSRLFAGMTEKEAANVRATLVDRLGRATPGAQDASGEVFSAGTFLTNWNRMTPQAKASIFPNPQMRKDLNDLAKIAEGSKAGQAMANHSNTGIALGANVGAGTALFMSHPGFAAAGAGAQYVTGKLMASPGFARILARTAKLPPEVAPRKLSEQLGVLAGREAAIAGDARSLQQHLQQAISQSPASRAAASEQEQ